ncbi:MAG TPA: hypothetical protein VGJ36_07720 [Gemmatimonadales bacterium]
MIALFSHSVLALLIASGLAVTPAPGPGQCDDPLPIDPAIVTQEMKLKTFGRADQAGPACHLRWEGGSSPTLMIYGPTAMADVGRTFSSTKQAADQYAGESPKGVEPLPGVKGGYMVFDPSTPNRRVFVEYQRKVYMIVSQDQVPLGVLAKAVVQRLGFERK